MLLTKGDKSDTSPFKDVVVKSNKLALKYAISEHFFGIGTSVNDLLASDDFYDQCEKANIRCFGFGKEMQDTTCSGI